MSRVSLAALLVLFLLQPAPAIGTFFQEAFEERLRDFPESATNVGRREHDDRWTDWSKQGRELRRTHLTSRLAALKRFPAEQLSGQDRVTARLLEYEWQSNLDAFDVQDYLLRIGQLNGLHNEVYNTIDRMQVRSVQDGERVLARLRAIPQFVDQSIALFDEGIARGLTQPRVVVDLVTEQLAAQIAQDSGATPLLQAFRRLPETLPRAEQDRLKAQGIQAYDQQFLPAWRKLHAYVKGTYAGRARKTDGIGGIPGGKEAYRILVRRLTTTDATPEEIHALGQQEVKRIEGEMDTLIRGTGFSGSIADFERQIAASPDQHFKNKDEMLAFCRNIAKIIEPELPNQFRTIPVLLYGVRPIPPDREAASATNAQSPTPDYSSPGWFNLNTYLPEKQVKYDKEALVLHEAVPGHIFQGSIALALRDLPDIRKFYSNSAYGEGWALYAEALGSQLGLYRDPYSKFGQLASERFRAVRLVVDTGMHALGWPREQAVAYFKQHAPDVSLAEIDRYISWPGQALSYKMGQLAIRQMRTRAEQELGAKFDVREFHDVVLRNGRLPLTLLGEQVDEYLRAAR